MRLTIIVRRLCHIFDRSKATCIDLKMVVVCRRRVCPCYASRSFLPLLALAGCGGDPHCCCHCGQQTRYPGAALAGDYTDTTVVRLCIVYEVVIICSTTRLCSCWWCRYFHIKIREVKYETNYDKVLQEKLLLLLKFITETEKQDKYINKLFSISKVNHLLIHLQN